MATFTNKLRNVYLFIILILLTSIAYFPILSFPYTNWDDRFFILENTILRLPWQDFFYKIFQFSSIPHEQLYIPITYLSFWLEYAIFQQFHPTISHAINLTFHLLNSGCLFLILKKFIRSQSILFFILICFILHPIQIEPVVWVMGRKDLLATFFSLLTIFIILSFPRRLTNLSQWILLIGIIGWGSTLAILSKPSAIGLPCIAGLLLWIRHIRPHPKSNFLKYWNTSKLCLFLFKSSVCLVLLITLVSFFFLSFFRPTLPSSPFILPKSLRTIFVLPLFLDFSCTKILGAEPYLAFYVHPWLPELMWSKIVKGSGILLGIIGLVVYSRPLLSRREKLVFFILTFFGVVFSIPILGTYLDTRPFLFADRYLYILFPVFLCLSMLISKTIGRLFKIPSSLLLAILGVWIFNLLIRFPQTLYQWQDSVQLWGNVVHYYQLYYGHVADGVWNTYGSALVDQGRFSEAIHAYQRAIGENPRNILAWNNLGDVWLRSNFPQRSMFFLRQAMRIDPSYPSPWHNLALAWLALGRPHKAKEVLEIMVQRISHPPHASLGLLAELYEKEKDYQKALEYWGKAYRSAPWVNQYRERWLRLKSLFNY